MLPLVEVPTTDVVVRDGSTVCVRRATAADLDALSRFFHSLSNESLYYRFLGFPALTEARLRALTATDDRTGVGLALTWAVDDVEDVVRTLKTKGVTFEHYDLPETRREGDVHVSGDIKVAWFKDPDGNILSVVNR